MTGEARGVVPEYPERRGRGRCRWRSRRRRAPGRATPGCRPGAGGTGRFPCGNGPRSSSPRRTGRPGPAPAPGLLRRRRDVAVGDGVGEELQTVGAGVRAFLLETQGGLFLGGEEGDEDVDAEPFQRQDLVLEPVAAAGTGHHREFSGTGGFDPVDLGTANSRRPRDRKCCRSTGAPSPWPGVPRGRGGARRPTGCGRARGSPRRCGRC